MHFIFDLIRKIIRGKEFGEPVVLWGDGRQKREVVLVDDFVRLLWQLTERFDNEVFNIGAGEEHSIRTFAASICGIVGYPAEKIVYDSTRYVGATSKCLNVEKITAAVGPLKLAPLHEGLAKTIAWFYDSGAYRGAAVTADAVAGNR
jgi:GDP-L-fucose synthase